MADPRWLPDMLLAVEAEAAAFYAALARRFAHRPELRALWMELADDEREHAKWIRETRELMGGEAPNLPIAPLEATLEELKRQREWLEHGAGLVVDPLAATIALETSEVNDTLVEFLVTSSAQHSSELLARETVLHLRRLTAAVDRLSHPELTALLKGVSARAERALQPRRTILVVDDETDMLETCARIFQRSGYACLTASSGQEALAVLERQRPDLIFTDLRMPRGDGLTLLRRAKQVAPDIPVVVFTAYVSEASAREVLDAGAAAYLAKPFTASQLRQAVEQTLGAGGHEKGARDGL